MIYNLFFYWVEERVDPLLPEELAARNIAILADISVDNKEVEANLVTDDFKQITAERAQINKN